MHVQQDVAFLFSGVSDGLAGDFQAGVLGVVGTQVEFEFLDELAGLALVEFVVEEFDRVAVASLRDLGQAQFVVALFVRRLAELVEAGSGFVDASVGDYEHGGAPDMSGAQAGVAQRSVGRHRVRVREGSESAFLIPLPLKPTRVRIESQCAAGFEFTPAFYWIASLDFAGQMVRCAFGFTAPYAGLIVTLRRDRCRKLLTG